MSAVASLASAVPAFDVQALRADFPCLQQEVNGRPLVYLDNAATTQKPRQVIDAVAGYYRHDNANVHRAAHALSGRATAQFEAARARIAAFINAASDREVIWTAGTTAAINLVAHSWAREFLRAGDRILVSWLEHHANIVPWQMAAAAYGAEVVPIPVSEAGEIDLDALDALLDHRVRLVAVNHVSNALGTVNPVHEICSRAQAAGAHVLVDGAQAVGHFAVDVQQLDCDFYAFSGHKLYGPTGIGVLWGREALLEQMPPFMTGGEMIDRVSFEGTTFNTLPFKFEPGTPNVAGAIGLAAAVDYLATLDREAAAAHEQALFLRLLEGAGRIAGLRRIGAPAHSAGIFSFVLDGCHPSDVGMLLDEQGIAVRTGHHCTQPLMERFGLPGTARASIAMYNTVSEVEALLEGIERAAALFAG